MNKLRTVTPKELSQVEGGHRKGPDHPPGWVKWCYWSYDFRHHRYHKDFCTWFPSYWFPYPGSGWVPG
jgi:hypothetical protein